MAITKAERQRYGRIGAHQLHATHDSRELTAAARQSANTALNQRLLAAIDEHSPGLSEVERQRRLVHARKAHFLRLSAAAAEARRTNRSTGS